MDLSPLPIVCLVSQKYQKSPNCKKELAYADSQNKHIFPCMVEEGYKGAGWLGLIIAGKLYHDFSRVGESVQEIAKRLAQAIKDKFKDEFRDANSNVDDSTNTGSQKEVESTEQEMFIKNFKGKVYHFNNPDRQKSSRVYFNDFEDVYIDRSDYSKRLTKRYTRFDGEQVTEADVSTFGLSQVKILSERVLSATYHFNVVYRAISQSVCE